MKPKKRIISTEDGSHTLYVDSLNEYYHSRYGAIQESNHVFIANGLNGIKRKDVVVLEVGFGTGLNALLTYITGKKNQIKIQYEAIELFPLEKSLVQELNFARFLNMDNPHLLIDMHMLPWNQIHTLSELFSLHKILQDFNHFTPEQKYSVVYFDAFAPEKQPEMWSEENFAKLFYALETEGILVTYCAKGAIKRTLQRVGFRVELLKGPPGKHEMIRAVKPG
ncbi:MAG: tRNA (5-methylaminomethyl-2-thiouridine)(34)-methyltransferase MnmD [Bacteroidales bacterium]|nr:tRNA (5-methylaminomethyl-2-thiouridine)(34)-methyltransferase MnmD [Bacteroidales bacterium]MBS3775900.1 tRNA (5-methylaminomethyl-2-thiouridine)(34)-methyltransferase MnmD [Bacteroidales bacterium]